MGHIVKNALFLLGGGGFNNHNGSTLLSIISHQHQSTCTIWK